MRSRRVGSSDWRVDIQGDLLGSKEELLAGLTLRSGEIFSRKVLRENMSTQRPLCQ
ncbi:MAG: hypothetical protein R2864_13435 [Syntrophotaleaceae bacterium]